MNRNLRLRNLSDNKDRLGVAAVAQAFEKLGWIFRELPTSDYGVDAIVEVVGGGVLRGEVFGVQIKSGGSHLRRQKEGIILYADNEHVEYWLQHTLPIVVVVSEESSEKIRWQSVQVEFLERTPTK